MILNIFQVSLKLFMIACFEASSNQLNRLDESPEMYGKYANRGNILWQQLNPFHQTFYSKKTTFYLMHRAHSACFSCTYLFNSFVYIESYELFSILSVQHFSSSFCLSLKTFLFPLDIICSKDTNDSTHTHTQRKYGAIISSVP